jgi:hypothetical protein
MIKKLHVSVKIFFKNPIIIRVSDSITKETNYRVAVNFCKKRIFGTYGHSYVNIETISNAEPQIIGPIVNFPVNSESRSYFCFSDEQDALLFLLSMPEFTKRVQLWPSNLTFLIYEFQYDCPLEA